MRFLVTMAILAAGTAPLLAQSAPIKMGLWEKTIVTTVGDGAPTTVKDQSCITPAVWQKLSAAMLKQHEGCTAKTVKTGNTYTFNGTCNVPQIAPIVISGSETIQDSEHIVTDSHSTSMENGKPQKFAIRSTSKFLSASCGSVKPDDID